MTKDAFKPQKLIGRQCELEQICEILAADQDLMLTGVTGSGRRALIRYAAQQIGARILEIDCLRATTSSRFLELMASGIVHIFATAAERTFIGQWACGYPLQVEQPTPYQTRLVWQVSQNDEWLILQALLNLPQVMAEHLNCRVVFVFQNFPHIRSWDRAGRWESYLRQEIQQQNRVSYVVLATTPEDWVEDSSVQLVCLLPVQCQEIETWVVEAMAAVDLEFEVDALKLFLDYSQGHVGDAIALARRIWSDHCCFYQDEQASFTGQFSPKLIQLHHVHCSTLRLVEDLSVTFESLLLLLPPIQARVLESLAIDPTDSPHSRPYLQKHQFSRGGGFQGALTGLEQKGLIYGAKARYRVALPLLSFWLKHRIL
ncbi:MAG: ATP-binding protein [Nostoc sp. ChiSLP01]|nr:ATP-binding protein [Nostoc sp. CmiSLP01]MDZ8284475.1 ATP-binding protein [Nostoc sp. ChiSLP01]